MSTTFLDFAELKGRVSISQVATMLGLKMKGQGAQLRGPCPFCRAGGERAMAINTDKQSFYCFSAKAGGDCIALASHVLNASPRDAAQQIATHFRFTGSPAPEATVPPAPRKFDAEAYLQGLNPAAHELEPLQVAVDTLKAWKAGYSKTGVLRGKLAIALCDRDGNVLGFAGRALDCPQLTFPNGVEPRDFIFGADKIANGEVRLLRDPLEVMQAWELEEAALCFLTEDVEPQQLEMLASLLDAKKAKIFL